MSKEISIGEIIELLRGKNYNFIFHGDKNDIINGFSTLFNYKQNTMTFVSSLNKFNDYKELFKSKKIKLMIADTSESVSDCFVNTIQIEKPKQAFFTILDYLFDDNAEEYTITSQEKYYRKHSFVSNNAKIGKNVKIGKGCIIEGNVSIGDNTVIHHNVVIKSNTKIGENCSIFSGVVIGERGFNPSTQKEGNRIMLKHYGGVTIENDVHIGENCCLIRGSIDDTIIKQGAKLNTMVHVAHNCVIGENTVITMPTHICGSVIIGRNCHIAANTIRNQCTIGDNAILGLGSVVVKDVAKGLTVVGNPAKPLEK